MSKAPAFQFYYDRFNSSTALWDDCQVGQYIRLMMCQANKGYVTEKELKKVVHDNDPDVLSKFIQIAPGQYANEVLTGILTERDAYRESRKKNRLDGIERKKNGSYDNHMNKTGVSYDDHNAHSTTTTTSTTTPNITTTTTTTKKNTAEADLYASDRSSVISELNSLTGRAFDPDAEYFKKNLNARIKQYGVPDLIDMIRFIVYKRKGTDWEQYLKPDTIFRPEKAASYMVDMKHHRDNGLMPKKDKANNGGVKTQDELMEEIRIHRLKKQQFA